MNVDSRQLPFWCSEDLQPTSTSHHVATQKSASTYSLQVLYLPVCRRFQSIVVIVQSWAIIYFIHKSRADYKTSLDTPGSFLGQNTYSPYGHTDKWTMPGVNLVDVVNHVRSTRFRRMNEILSSNHRARFIRRTDNVYGRNVAPGSMRRRAPERAEALRLQVFAKFSYGAVVQVLVEHVFRVFGSNCDDASLRCTLAIMSFSNTSAYSRLDPSSFLAPYSHEYYKKSP